MDRTFWHKQTAEKPLFPDLLWSRPENKSQSGKLLIVGGNAHGFAAPAEAYSAAQRAGIGLTRVLLPHHVKRLLPRGAQDMEFGPSNPSGSFARSALAEIMDLANWADGVLLAGDFGRNSETAIVLEQFLTKHTGQVTITQDAADYFTKTPGVVISRPETLLVLSFAQLQKLALSASFPTALTFSMDFLRLIDALREFTGRCKAAVIVKHLRNIFVAVNGEVSTTKLHPDPEIWRLKTAAVAAVWQLQNPTKPFEALTTSLIHKSGGRGGNRTLNP